MRAKKGFTFDACHGCGQVPTHWQGRRKDAVCSNCENTLKLANKFADERSGSCEMVQVAIPTQSHWLPYLRLSGIRNSAHVGVQKAIWKLAMDCSSPVFEGADLFEAQYLIPLQKNERTDWRPSRPEDVRLMPKNVAAQFAVLYAAIKHELDNCYAEGKDRGQNLLAQLAAGDLSVNDFNEISLARK